MKSFRAILFFMFSLILLSAQPAKADLAAAQEAYLLKDYTKAMQEYMKNDDPRSFYQIGYMYDHGEGVAQDGKEAAVWYRKAAEKGHAKAQYRLGMLYSTGFGVEQDQKEAERWFRRAAGQGFRPAKDAIKRLNKTSDAGK